MSELKKTFHTADVCVIGGGLAGTFAAIAAARHGAHVVLMQDRPVLGGNASSEIRMWVSGAGTRVRNLQETGIMEEFLLENMHLNPDRNFSVWDSIFYGKVKAEKNIELMLNCACCAAECRDGRIESVTGFQLTTYTWRTVKAKIFIDCSGDSILAELADAEYMVGREAKSQFGEAFGLPEADRKTMGMSLMIQAHETDHPCPFTAPDWAYRYNTDEEMKFKPHECLDKINTNFYWIELGGEADSIHDTETTRDELLKIAFGVYFEDIFLVRGNRVAVRAVREYLFARFRVVQRDVGSGFAVIVGRKRAAYGSTLGNVVTVEEQIFFLLMNESEEIKLVLSERFSVFLDAVYARRAVDMNGIVFDFETNVFIARFHSFFGLFLGA